MNQHDQMREAFERFRDQRNALLEQEGHKPGSKFHVNNIHYATWETACATVGDYEKIIADHRRLVRRLDVLINGEEGAAQQASLCDIVAQVESQGLIKPTQAAPTERAPLMPSEFLQMRRQLEAEWVALRKLQKAERNLVRLTQADIFRCWRESAEVTPTCDHHIHFANAIMDAMERLNGGQR